MAVVYTKNEKRSIIIRAGLLGVLLIAIVIVIVLLVNSFSIKEGFNEITSTYVNNYSISSELNLKYYLKKDSNSIASNKDKLEKLYAESLDTIYELIDSKQEYSNINNIYYINNHPNEIIEIDKTLYDVLKNIYDADSRFLLYGSLYQYWDSLYFSLEEKQRDNLDPSYNLEYKNLINEFVTNSINYISIDFLEDNKIILNVSDEYNSIYQDEYIEYIGLGYLTNMIIMDYIKACFIDNGYNDGYIISKDGYLLSFGGEHLSLYPLVTDIYNTYYAKVEISNGNAYIGSYDYSINDSYRYYETKYNETKVKRNQYINNDTGYQYDLGNSFYYKEGYLFDTYKEMIKLVNGDSFDLSYIKFNNDESNPKITTNVKTGITFRNGIEVSYE